MKDIYEAIVTAFDADGDLSTMFPNGLFNDVGYDQEELPVCVIAGLVETPSYSTCDEMSSLLIQFTVFSTTDSQCFDAIALLKAEFDDKALTLSNATPIRVTRVSVTPPRKIDNAWRGTVDYMVDTLV
jgi:hypothetical protein